MVISVIVPIYKIENELDRCIKSIIDQTYKKLEIILVDDESPDNCPEICDKYAEKDGRITVIHKENGGLSSARNAGLNAASGEYILFVDGDDYIEPESCERLLAGIKGGMDFVVAPFKEISGEHIVVRGLISAQENTMYSPRDFAILAIQENNWHASACCKLYRRNFLIENSLFFKEGLLFEDTHLFLKVFFSAKRVGYVSFPFYNYMIRQGSIMQSKDLRRKADMIVEIYDEWMDQIAVVRDREYQRYLYGAMLRFYLRNCRMFQIRTWRIKKTNFFFAMKYALNFVERLKILGFVFLKDIFLRL